MNRGEYLDLLTKIAQEWRKEGIIPDIERNSHLHHHNKEYFANCTQDLKDYTDAVITMFINKVGTYFGCDYALNAQDVYFPEFREEIKKVEKMRREDLSKAEQMLIELENKVEEARKS